MVAMDLFTYHHINQPKNCPSIQFDYMEKDTGNYWRIWSAIDTICLYRMGAELSKRDNALRNMEADLMVRRLECAFLLAQKGIFQFRFTSGWRFNDLDFRDTSTVTPTLKSGTSKEIDEIIDWFNALSTQTLIRRAAEDAYMALIINREELFFIYRGFEWLKKAMKVSWDKLSETIDIPRESINSLKKIANNPEEAARHAAESGLKVYLDEEVLPDWVGGLLHGIVHARSKIDPDFLTYIQKHGDPWPLE
jgi:predicted peroxiredoxin